MENQKHVVTGIWRILRPDTRQYKQQSIEIQLDQLVAVEIPAEMIYKSFTDPKTGEIRDILTVAGVRYVQQQFEALYLEPKADEGWDSSLESAKQAVDAKSEAPKAESDSDWSDTGWSEDGSSADEKPAKADAKDDADEWDNDVFGSDNTPDTETDEKWEDGDWA